MKREDVIKDLQRTRDFGMKKYSKFHNDNDIAIQAVNLNAWNIKYTSEELRSNKDLMMYCARRMPMTIYFATKELLDDMDIALVVAQESPQLLRKFGSKIQALVEGKEPVQALKKAIYQRDIQDQLKMKPTQMTATISV